MDLWEYIIHTYEVINLDNINQLGQYQQDKGRLLSHLIKDEPILKNVPLEPYFNEKFMQNYMKN